MNAFVDECRREWRRLHVPDELADEMAAELEADLAEAGSTEELLGAAAADPTLLAREWATERGLVRATPRRRSLVPSLLATLALAATIAGAALTIHESDSGSSRPRQPIAVVDAGSGIWTAPSQRTPIAVTSLQLAAEDARLRVRLLELNQSEGTSDQSNSLGLVLLIGGLAVLGPLTLFGLRRTALDR